MDKFKNGRSYHGYDEIMGGKLKGATDRQDYFYFFCPKYPDNQIMCILEYGEHTRENENPYNDKCKSMVLLWCSNCIVKNAEIQILLKVQIQGGREVSTQKNC